MQGLITRKLGPKAAIEYAALAAQVGVMPEVPDLSAPTHEPWLEVAGRLFLLVALRDLDAIKAWHPNEDKPGRKVVTSTPEMLLRYRNNVVMALQAVGQAEWKRR